jgi:hypothetical protein
MIGHEWRQLATLLGITIKKQEQLLESHPHATQQCIYETLQMWRDSEHGSKEDIKGTLCKALRAVRRKDIVEMILSEQARGSGEAVNSVIISVH